MPFARVASRTKFGILERDFPFHGPLLSTIVPVAMRLGVTPVYIPNTMVKT